MWDRLLIFCGCLLLSGTGWGSFSGDISHESNWEPARDEPWTHHRTRFFLSQKQENRKLGRTKIFWGYEASGFYVHDEALDPGEREEFEIENLLVSGFFGRFQGKAGLQTVNWGETLGPSLVDLINPRDLRDPSRWFLADRKLSAPLFLLGITRRNTILEAWVSPLARPSLLPDQLQSFPISVESASPTTDFGLRWGSRYRGWDFKAYAFQHPSRVPNLVLVPQLPQPIINASFSRQRSYGMTLSQAWDNIVLRTEFLHAERDKSPSGNLVDFGKNQFVFGLDGTWGEHFFWATEMRYSHQESVLPENIDVGWIIAQLRWNLWDDRLKPLFYLTQRVDARDAYERFELASNILPAWEASVSYETFQSDEFGFFKTLDLGNRYSFQIRWEF